MNCKWQLTDRGQICKHFQEALKTIRIKLTQKSYQNNATLPTQNNLNTKRTQEIVLNVMYNTPLKQTCEASGF